MKSKKIQISVIIPVYNPDKKLISLLKSLKKEIKKFKSEIILVNDIGDETNNKILNNVKKIHKNLRVINLKKNYGQHYATLLGISVARGDFLVTLDEDYQHDPKYLNKMQKYLLSKKLDVVFVKFKDKKHNFSKRNFSRINQFLLKKVFKLDSDIETSSYRLMSKTFAQKLINDFFVEPNLSCMILNNTSKIGNLDGIHARESKTNYNFFKSFKIFKALIIDYSNILINFSIIMAMSFCIIGAIFGINVIYDSLTAERKPSPGWASTIVIISMFSSLILFVQFVQSTYISRNLSKTKINSLKNKMLK